MTLSIVIPTRNRPHLLRRALLSAVRACGEGDEIVVVNDGDPDGLSEIGDLVVPGQVIVCDGLGQGAASARNLGVVRARHDVVLFLDDDDELIGDYPARVRAATECSDAPLWGAAAILRQAGVTQDLTKVVRRLSNGRQEPNRDFRQKLFAASAGLWVRKDLFHQVGGFPVDQVVDEDSGFCCQLLALGREPWYEVEPGVLRHVQRHEDGQNDQLTRTVPADVTVACYFRTFERNRGALTDYRGAVWFLALRYIRRASSAALPVNLGAVIGAVSKPREKAALLVYYLFRRAQMQVTGKSTGNG